MNECLQLEKGAWGRRYWRDVTIRASASHGAKPGAGAGAGETTQRQRALW
jgi:hypothetical protein